MKMFKKLKKLIMGACAVSMAAMLMLPGASVSAGTDDNNGLGTIDMSKDATLSVYYYFDTYGDIPSYGKMEGVNTKVYKIASISEKGEFTVLSPYDSLGLNITDMYSISDQEKWNSIITEASKCIAANGIQPSYTGTSDTEGYTKFGTVDKGLYYGVSDPVVKEGIQYKYWDFLSVVPGPNNLDENAGNAWDGTWKNAQYDVIAVPKREAVKLEDDPELFSVYKQWFDDGENRPSSVGVKIYCDGNLYQTVDLSNSNNWQYSWNYEKGHVFTVEEDLGTNSNYTANISRNENTFIIVNTKKPEQPESPDEPDEPDTPNKPDKPDRPDSPNKPDNPDNPDNPDKPGDSTPPDDDGSVLGAIRKFIGELPEVLGARRLPQTGQLWWPIPILAIIGLVLIILGFRSERHRK